MGKKYRPIVIWLILLVFTCFSIVLFCMPIGISRKFWVGLSGAAVFICFIVTLSYYIEFQDTKIIIRYSLSSDYNRKYRTIFKTHIISFDDILNMDYENGSKRLIIILKSGDSLGISLGGFLNSHKIEIMNLVFAAKRRIYESQS